MINRTHRFHGYGSLRFVYQKGKTYRGQYGSIKCILNNRRKTYRMAVVVSRKVHKSAVVRNRIRRRIYEIVRCEEPNIIAPYDMIFTVFSDQVATIPYDELRQGILGKMQEAGIIPAETATTDDHRAIVEPKEL
jgi:ribonuclease P protein component